MRYLQDWIARYDVVCDGWPSKVNILVFTGCAAWRAYMQVDDVLGIEDEDLW
jgi:hypothetical protein